MSQDPTRLQMVAQVQHLSREQASFYCIRAFLLLFLAGSSVLKLTHNLCSFLWVVQSPVRIKQIGPNPRESDEQRLRLSAVGATWLEAVCSHFSVAVDGT